MEYRNRKIDLQRVISDLLKEVKEIEGSERTQGQKTQAFKRAATKVINKLYGKRSSQQANSLSHNTASKYLTKVRNAVTEKGWKHHALDETLARLKVRYPHSIHLIEPLEDRPLTETRVAVKALRDKLLQAERLQKKVATVDIKSGRYASLINDVARVFPLWKSELQWLKPLKAEQREEAMERFMAMLDETHSLYNDLDGLKIDHEVMRHLVKDAFAATSRSSESAFSLATKKGQTIDVDYPTIMARCEFLLSPTSPNLWTWEALTTGIALATGRRAIEVLVQGQFEKTGPNTLRFSGQAKERGGVDYDNAFEIYSLVESDKVLAAVDMLRKMPKVVDLINTEAERHFQFNEVVHNRTAAYLNEFIRNMMKGAGIETGIAGRDWVFKDTRAIYAAICFKLFFDTDPRWKNKDQDVFFKELLGHSDMKAQAHYKQFKVPRAGEKWETLVVETKDRHAALVAMDDDERITASSAMKRMHENVKTLVAQDPGIDVKQRTIKDAFGGNYATIRKYLEIVDDALSFNMSLDSILKKEPVNKVSTNPGDRQQAKTTQPLEDEPKKIRPKFKANHLNGCQWHVTIELENERRSFEVMAKNMPEAMKAAWGEWEFVTQSNPPVALLKSGDMWKATISQNGKIYVELYQKGRKEEARKDAIAMLREYGR